MVGASGIAARSELHMLLAACADAVLLHGSVTEDELCRRPFPRTSSLLQIISGKIWRDNDACIRLSAQAKNDMT